ncbi:MAG: HNH endonuclease [Cyclobacteriaceae bacterium]
MRKCIWCSKDEEHVTFERKAHTIPQSLGGKHICSEVCDSCNNYFGSPSNQLPSIEVAFKELFNISRHILLRTTGEYKKISRYKSEFFNVNWDNLSIRVKPRYQLKSNFQENLARQLRRGFYKVFIEDRSRTIGDVHSNKFDFIRAFARYNLGDYPLFYFYPAKDIVYFSTPDAIEPELRFSEYHKEVMTKFGFYEFFLMGHYFSIPVSTNYMLTWELYL